jgi:hypothetical protein
LPIVSLNDIKTPISEEDSIIMIKRIIENKNILETAQKLVEEKEEKKKNDMMDDKRKEKIMLVI